MTLIGGFRPNNVPVLIGDFVLTSRGKRAGLWKKIVRVADNCALSWTGSALVATEVFRDIYANLNSQRVAQSDLELFLNGYKDGHFAAQEAHFIGWIIDEEPRCFLWNSSYPCELFYGDPTFDGSGEEVLSLADKVHQHDSMCTDKTLDGAIDQILSWLSRLMLRESHLGPKHNESFGFAYEAMFYNGQMFEYLNDVFFMNLVCELDDNDMLAHNIRAKPTLIEPTYKYLGCDAYSVMLRIDISRKHNMVDFIFPPGLSAEQDKALTEDFQKHWVNPQMHRTNLKSKFYCIFLNLLVGGTCIDPLIITTRGNMPAEHRYVDVISGEHGGEELLIQFPREILQTILDRWRSQQ